MRKLIAIVAVVSAAATPAAAVVPDDGRTVTRQYNAPTSGDGPNFSFTFGGQSFKTRPTESSFDLETEDASGQTIWVVVYESRKGEDKEIGEICGATEQPIEFSPGATIAVRFRTGIPEGCAGEPLGQATTGTMTATFYRN